MSDESKHYAMVVVVEAPSALAAWEGAAHRLALGERVELLDYEAQYLGDPFRVPAENQGEEYATHSIELGSDAKDRGNTAHPFTLAAPSALEGGPE